MNTRPDNLPTAQVSADSTAHLPSTLTGADSARISAAISAARSPQTRRAYATQWAAWTSWCASRCASPLPAAPVELAAYLAERSESASIATVRMAKAAIVFAHKAKGEDSPATDDVLEVLRGLATSKAAERGKHGLGGAGAGGGEFTGKPDQSLARNA